VGAQLHAAILGYPQLSVLAVDEGGRIPFEPQKVLCGRKLRPSQKTDLTDDRRATLLVRDTLDCPQNALIEELLAERCPFASVKTPKLAIPVVHQMGPAFEMLFQDELQHLFGQIRLLIEDFRGRVFGDAVCDLLDLARVEWRLASLFVFGQQCSKQRMSGKTVTP
jgi:hypothetical protein